MKIESRVLRRLGPVPFWRGHGKCLVELERIYRAATERANAILQIPPPPRSTSAAHAEWRTTGQKA